MISFIAIGALFVSDVHGREFDLDRFHGHGHVVGIRFGPTTHSRHTLERRRADDKEEMTVAFDDGEEMMVALTDSTDPALTSCCAKYYNQGDMDIVVSGCEGKDRSVSIGGEGSWTYDASTGETTQAEIGKEACKAMKLPEDPLVGAFGIPSAAAPEVAGNVDVSDDTQDIFLTEIRYYYDATLLERFNGDHELAKNTVREIHEHTSVHMRADSIGRKVVLDIAADIEFIDQRLHAIIGNELEDPFADFRQTLRRQNKCNDNVAFHHLITDHVPTDTVAGVAFVGTACASNCWNVGITELWNSIAGAAVVMAHELGHNMGMLHTDEPPNLNRGCEGIMTPGRFADSWSQCSREAWTRDYDEFLSSNGRRRTDRCFKPHDSLDAPTPDPTPSPTEQPTPVSCVCSGVTNARGFGGSNCSMEWCYTDPGSCVDGKRSKLVGDAEWSYLACLGEGSLNTPPQDNEVQINILACDTLYGMDIDGGFVHHAQSGATDINTDKACSELCSGAEGCTAWVRQPSTNNCWLTTQSGQIQWKVRGDRNAGLVCNNAECVTDDEWRSSTGLSCHDYERFRYCENDAPYGSGWSIASFGLFEVYADANGVDATGACCACGASPPDSPSPTPSPTANPTPQTSADCRCSGVANAFGFGGSSCSVEFCYTEPGVCADGRRSGLLTNQEWSYSACLAEPLPTEQPTAMPTANPTPTPTRSPVTPPTGCDESFSGDGSDYRGCQTRTQSGRRCQRWTSQWPHRHSRTPRNYPNAGLGNHNYCRNPDGDRRMWCYTTDRRSRFEYCDPL